MNKTSMKYLTASTSEPKDAKHLNYTGYICIDPVNGLLISTDGRRLHSLPLNGELADTEISNRRYIQSSILKNSFNDKGRHHTWDIKDPDTRNDVVSDYVVTYPDYMKILEHLDNYDIEINLSGKQTDQFTQAIKAMRKIADMESSEFQGRSMLIMEIRESGVLLAVLTNCSDWKSAIKRDNASGYFVPLNNNTILAQVFISCKVEFKEPRPNHSVIAVNLGFLYDSIPFPKLPVKIEVKHNEGGKEYGEPSLNPMIVTQGIYRSIIMPVRCTAID